MKVIAYWNVPEWTETGSLCHSWCVAREFPWESVRNAGWARTVRASWVTLCCASVVVGSRPVVVRAASDDWPNSVQAVCWDSSAWISLVSIVCHRPPNWSPRPACCRPACTGWSRSRTRASVPRASSSSAHCCRPVNWCNRSPDCPQTLRCWSSSRWSWPLSWPTSWTHWNCRYCSPSCSRWTRGRGGPLRRLRYRSLASWPRVAC